MRESKSLAVASAVKLDPVRAEAVREEVTFSLIYGQGWPEEDDVSIYRCKKSLPQVHFSGKREGVLRVAYFPSRYSFSVFTFQILSFVRTPPRMFFTVSKEVTMEWSMLL